MGTQHMRTSNHGYEAVPPAEVKAFPELLRRAGYATVNVAKTDYQFGEPFTVWDQNLGSFNEQPDLAPWRQLPKNKPFMAMINLMSTHESRLATTDSRGTGEFGKALKSWVAAREKLVEPVTDPDVVTVPPYYPDTPAVRASIAQHYDNIHYMDGEVGRILEYLEKDGLHENTIVIWTTDHGDGLPRAKRSIYDSGLKVPLVIRYPDGRGRGAINTGLVSAVDIAPTILGIAGVDKPHFIQGHDFLSASGGARLRLRGSRSHG
jgi:arylsulfatase A-like enzyme